MADKLSFRERLAQLQLAFTRTRAVDSRLVPIMAGAAAVVLAVFTGTGLLLDSPILWTVLGLLGALLAAMLVFGRRAAKAALTQIEGRPGAAAAVLQAMRGPWRLTPAVAITRKQDFVHRVVGRPGVVLVGEGSRARIASLLKQEHRKAARAAGDVPVHDVSVGDGDGQIPLSALQAHLTRLPRKLKAREVAELDKRLSALSSSDLPMPKGPLPGGGRRPRQR